MASIESCRSSFSSLSFGNLTPNSSTCHRINALDAPGSSRTARAGNETVPEKVPGKTPTFTVGDRNNT